MGGTQTTFKEWYDKNKAEFNSKRQERYANDPDYRQKVIERQREYRKRHPAKPRKSKGTSLKETKDGRLVQAWRIGKVAKLIRRTEQTIRDWEEKGMIPAPTVESVHRYYTAPQIQLMRELAILIDITFYGRRDAMAESIAEKTREIHSNWEN